MTGVRHFKVWKIEKGEHRCSPFLMFDLAAEACQCQLRISYEIKVRKIVLQRERPRRRAERIGPRFDIDDIEIICRTILKDEVAERTGQCSSLLAGAGVSQRHRHTTKRHTARR